MYLLVQLRKTQKNMKACSRESLRNSPNMVRSSLVRWKLKNILKTSQFDTYRRSISQDWRILSQAIESSWQSCSIQWWQIHKCPSIRWINVNKLCHIWMGVSFYLVAIYTDAFYRVGHGIFIRELKAKGIHSSVLDTNHHYSWHP